MLHDLCLLFNLVEHQDLENWVKFEAKHPNKTPSQGCISSGFLK